MATMMAMIMHSHRMTGHAHEHDHEHDHAHLHSHADPSVPHSHGPFSKPHSHLPADGQQISTEACLRWASRAESSPALRPWWCCLRQ